MEIGGIKNMDEEIKKEFEKVWNKIKELEGKNQLKINSERKENFVFLDKKKDHSSLLEELLKSDYCHSQDGLIIEKILGIFKENERPVVRKKVSDLLHTWKKRKKIDAIRIKGEKRHRYFWIENESSRSN